MSLRIDWAVVGIIALFVAVFGGLLIAVVHENQKKSKACETLWSEIQSKEAAKAYALVCR